MISLVQSGPTSEQKESGNIEGIELPGYVARFFPYVIE